MAADSRPQLRANGGLRTEQELFSSGGQRFQYLTFALASGKTTGPRRILGLDTNGS
jgi:hypothetical protein